MGRLAHLRLLAPITLDTWRAGRAVNALRPFTDKLLFGIPKPRWYRSRWQQQLQHLNAKKLRLPWLGDHLVLYSLDALPRAEPPTDPAGAS